MTARKTATEDGVCLRPSTSGRWLFGSAAIQFSATELQVRRVATFEVWNPIHILGHFCRYAGDYSELEFPQLHHKSQAQYFGGDGFMDTSAPSKSLHLFLFYCVCVCINLHCRKKAPLGNFFFRTTDLQNCFIFLYKLVTQHLLLVENLQLHGLMWYRNNELHKQ